MTTPEPKQKETGAFDSYFSITKRNSNLRTEVLAGVSTYLSLAYIFIVNPSILSNAGMSTSAVLFATIVASAASTLFMGFYARLPFVLAPGLEMNGFVAFVVCGTLGLPWQTALAAVFWSGVLCTILSMLTIRKKIVISIPEGLQANLAVSVGVFVMVIGFFLAKTIAFKDGVIDIHAFGSILSKEAISLWIGLALCLILHIKFRNRSGIIRPLVPGGFLIAIIVATIYCRSQGITQDNPAVLSSEMLSAVGQINWLSCFLIPQFYTVFIVLFLIDFYGSIGKFIGLTASTPELRSANGELEHMQEAMIVDGLGTMAGAALGTTSIITYVESAVGIKAGGRTGIAAIVCGLLMLASILFTPLVGMVPVVATAGVLVYVGWLLFPREEITSGRFDRFDVTVGVAMAIVSLLTFSLDKAMALGFLCYTIRQLRLGKVDPWLAGSCGLLIASIALQYLLK